MTRSLLIASLACLLAIGYVHADEPEKIVGGELALEAEFPSVISIRVNGQHFCGGAIISNRHILTAGHCVVPLKQMGLDKVTIVAGTNSLHYGGQSYRVSDAFHHPNFQMNVHWEYDIGVLKVASPIQFNNAVQKVDLPTATVPVNSNVVVAGWGMTAAPPSQAAPRLLKLMLKVLSHAECQRRFVGKRIRPDTICTFRAVNRGTCAGDSGSALIFGNVIQGVVSGGIPCARGYPDVFTDVSKFLPFVRQAMTY